MTVVRQNTYPPGVTQYRRQPLW